MQKINNAKIKMQKRKDNLYGVLPFSYFYYIAEAKTQGFFIIAIYYSYYIILGLPKGFDLVSIHDLPLWI